MRRTKLKTEKKTKSVLDDIKRKFKLRFRPAYDLQTSQRNRDRIPRDLFADILRRIDRLTTLSPWVSQASGLYVGARLRVVH